ncbi:hypothetical protein QQ020_17690 [Fulvivirgaceae bacterium BMA12]|uniref:Uncharacterized protein n=1 Tax=Agaribacillus aureus TaxID=3051825 RepID=A0ABT8L826_9BACT|nr:hypothetical protein [Fulvivirgaceae bacterium BMA12]
MRILTFYKDRALKPGIKRDYGISDVEQATKTLSINYVPNTPEERYQSGNEEEAIVKAGDFGRLINTFC